MLIVHNRTVLTTEFIYIDKSSGKIFKRENGQQVIEDFTQDDFIKAFEQLAEFKRQQQEKMLQIIDDRYEILEKEEADDLEEADRLKQEIARLKKDNEELEAVVDLEYPTPKR